MQLDLLGDDTWAPPHKKQSDSLHWKQKAGYAAPPGTGPEGKVCKQCRHAVSRHVGKHGKKIKVWKCRKSEGFTGTTPESDIAAKSPACREFNEHVIEHDT